MAAALLGVLLSETAAAQDWWNSSWTHRQQLALDNTPSATPLINFPLLVVLTGARVNFAELQGAGQDLRFVDADGVTVLAHEIEKWDPAGVCYVWVKVPQIDAGSDADFIWMYYGNPGAPDGQNRAAVWDPDFAMVHHLHTAADPVTDATANANHGANAGAAPGAAGQIGGAYAFNGSSSGIRVPHHASLSLSQAVTLSAWVCFNAIDGSRHNIVDKGQTGNQDNYWLSVNGDDLEFGFYRSGFRRYSTTGLAVQPQTWYYLAGVFDDSANRVRLYCDGVEVLSTWAPASMVLNTEAANIGKSQWGQYFNGAIDEVRVSRVARSAGWIQAEHRAACDAMIRWPEAGGGGRLPTLWGVNQADGRLFSVQNYTRPAATTTVYGPLQYDNAGTPANVGNGIQGMAIDASGFAYFACNKALGGYGGPVLLKFNLAGASATSPNVATVAGQINVGGNVFGLAIDPTTDALYALRNARLYTIDKTTGARISNLGTVSGSGYSLGTGADLAFDGSGSLYVIDAGDDHLYQVNKNTAAITALLDRDTGAPTGGDRGLAWDHVRGRLVASNVSQGALKHLTIGNGSNPVFGYLSSLGLTDVRAISFHPRTGGSGTTGVRILKWVEVP